MTDSTQDCQTEQLKFVCPNKIGDMVVFTKKKYLNYLDIRNSQKEAAGRTDLSEDRYSNLEERPYEIIQIQGCEEDGWWYTVLDAFYRPTTFNYIWSVDYDETFDYW